MTPSKESIRKILSFDQDSGKLFWKVRTGSSAAGSIAGTKNQFGYRQVSISGKRYFAHRIVWTLFNGDIPEDKEIDHINGERDDNRISNLRLVSRSQNNMNTAVSKRNTSGCKGVCYHSGNRCWYARVFVNRKVVASGSFKDKDKAIDFVTSQREKIFGVYNKQ